MIDVALMAAILDSLKDPLLFADTEHVIRYMNKAAVAHFDRGEELIIEILAAMQAGEEEWLISDDETRRIYMRAVRDRDGQLLGYYERYESLTK